jgi:NADPH:quinone reductase-like Zn-dependent oxidoreductase
MKAIVYQSYGSPDVLRLDDIEKPAPADNEVLLKIRAASVNPYDWHFMRGTPYIVRLFAGLRRPKVTRLGADVAGQVEAVGGKVTRFKTGDEVFGTCQGAFAEYVCTAESKLVLKPENITFEQAAGVPIAAFTALQGLRNKAKLQAGQKILINGAAGGVGTFAVQLAKSLGAEVAAVCSTRNIEMVRSIGADQVIDYTRDDFTRKGGRYDVIFDTIGNHSFLECSRALKPEGTLIVAGGPADLWMLVPLARSFKAFLLSRFISQRRLGLFAKANLEDLATLQSLLQSGRVKTIIDRSYGLSEVPAAIRYLEAGHARGKVIIAIPSPNSPV